MKTVFFVRHAKSSWKNPQWKDIDRPLNKRGKIDAPFMGKLLEVLLVNPDAIFSSPAKRAYDTARLIAKQLNGKKKDIHIEEDLYLPDADDFVQMLKKIPDSLDTVMFVSHNPGLLEAVNFFLEEQVIEIPTGTVIGVKFDIKNWKEAKKKQGVLAMNEYPKKYYVSEDSGPVFPEGF